MSSNQQQPGMIDSMIAKAMAKHRLHERLEAIEMDIKTLTILTAKQVGTPAFKAARARAKQIIESEKHA